ncbi:MAG: hypothetical protein LQ347_007101, partial [Umbilicaria vellea]
MPVSTAPHSSFSTFVPHPAHALLHTAVTGAQAGDVLQANNNEAEKDPFLSLLEQLAENEHSRGGPSELDYYLNTAAEG